METARRGVRRHAHLTFAALGRKIDSPRLLIESRRAPARWMFRRRRRRTNFAAGCGVNNSCPVQRFPLSPEAVCSAQLYPGAGSRR